MESFSLFYFLFHFFLNREEMVKRDQQDQNRTDEQTQTLLFYSSSPCISM